MTAPTPETASAPEKVKGPEHRPFPEDCKEVLQNLRGALTAALHTVDVDPARPQEVARKLGLHRNLTWKISKIVTGTNAFAAVPHVPGRSGMEILQKALSKAGASGTSVGQVEQAMEEFERLVRQHSGDRATLDLVAGGFVPGSSHSETLTQARRGAFRGNSATWSVQARVLMSLNILAPAADDPTRVDLVLVHGIVDFRRLRPDVAWPLFRRQTWDATGSRPLAVGKPIDREVDPQRAPLLADFCSPDMPELSVNHNGNELEYELPAGPVGRMGELTAMYGVTLPSVGPQFATADDKTCELGCNILTPVEMLHFDLLVHESLSWAMEPQADIFSLLEKRAVWGPDRRAIPLMEGDTEMHELGRGLATMSTPHVPRYNELLAHVFTQLGWDESAFRGFRLAVNYPPIPAIAMMSMDLAKPE